jgi:CheY-like chemotaxis protein
VEDGLHVDLWLTKPVRQSQLLDALMTTQASRLNRNRRGLAQAPRESALKLSTIEPFGTSYRVLVVDDNAVNQKVAVRMLERLGLRADVAANGLEAVRMVSELPYDAVLMDCQMPEMDGYTATEEIRRKENSGQRLAIIAMTAEAMSGAREQCLAAGMDDYITKPVKLEDLSRSIRTWVVGEANRVEVLTS